MARQRGARGLTIGQLLSLTLGFLIASVLIFSFGMWVGSDVAERRLREERQVVRLEVPTPAATPTLAFVFATPSPAATATEVVVQATPTETIVAATATRPRPMVPWAATPTAPRPVAPSATAVVAWTVQVRATTDLAEALQIVQRLRASGYDAYTRRREIAGATWYRVRVGQFSSRAEAKRLEQQLHREPEFEAAYVTQE